MYGFFPSFWELRSFPRTRGGGGGALDPCLGIGVPLGVWTGCRHCEQMAHSKWLENSFFNVSFLSVCKA